MSSWEVNDGKLALGDLEVERGGTIKDARLVWQTHGTLSAAGDNVIVYPCSYTASHDDLAWLIGPDGVLDPTRWFIVPSTTDLYFRVADNAAELPHLAHGRISPIETIWGHRAGSPQGLPTELAFLRQTVRDWLDR